jgi:hypothetical protein
MRKNQSSLPKAAANGHEVVVKLPVEKGSGCRAVWTSFRVGQDRLRHLSWGQIQC